MGMYEKLCPPSQTQQQKSPGQEIIKSSFFHQLLSLSLDQSKRTGRQGEKCRFTWQGNVQTVWPECV